MMSAILLPGGRYTTHAPLLALADEALEDRGARVERLAWTTPQGLPPDEGARFVAERAGPVIEAAIAEGRRPVIVAKSLGSFAAPIVAAHGLAAVWLTPLVGLPSVAEAIAANPAPALLVGGSADRTWDSAVAHRSGKRVLEIPGADHALRPPGRLAEFAAVLGRVGTAIEDFLDGVVIAGGERTDGGL